MQIFNQSVFEKWPLEDKSIQALITSPPYWSLRKYNIPDITIGGDKDCVHEWGDAVMGGKRKWTQGDKPSAKSMVAINYTKDEQRPNIDTHTCLACGAWKGQYGLEPTFKQYLKHSMLWMKEAIRVVKDDGIIFVNLADSYSGSNGSGGDYNNGGLREGQPKTKQNKQNYPSKSKCLIPERFAIMCVDELNLICRNHIVWFKTNGMPESVTDRFSKKWESIFMLTKKPDYYFDLDGVREAHKDVSIERLKRAVSNSNKWVNGADGQTRHGLSQPRPNLNKIAREEDEAEIKEHVSNSLAIYKERVGSMQTTKFKGGDYMCAELNPLGKNPGDVFQIPTQPSSEKHFAMWPEKLVERMILCSTKKGDTVLDCFAGSCTTGRVAVKHQRQFKGIDLGYIEMQEIRSKNIQVNLI
jgi:site-specific DNA-methyltransferase (cytosine-N4-specific)